MSTIYNIFFVTFFMKMARIESYYLKLLVTALPCYDRTAFTTTLFPPTSMTVTFLFFSIISPTVSTSTLSPLIRAMPDGRRGVSVIPSANSKFLRDSLDEENPSSDSCIENILENILYQSISKTGVEKRPHPKRR